MLAKGNRVKLHMTGMLDDGRIFYDTHIQGGIPVEFEIGHAGLLPALERELCLMEAGERRTIRIDAADAYGDYDPALRETVPLKDIPHGDELPLGEYIVFNTDEGPRRMKVAAIEDGTVTFDYNHELAGHDLRFDIDLLKVMRDSGDAVEAERFYHESECGCKGALGCHHDSADSPQGASALR